MDDFYLGAKSYISQFDEYVKKHALESFAKADHICYKCDSSENFEKMRKFFEDNSTYIYQSIISKRRIAVIKLKQPINTILGSISVVELSDQKPDNSQTNRYDHIEIYPTTILYDELVQRLEKGGEKIVKVERPHHTTHDIDIGNGFLVRLTHGPLIEKVKFEEMV